MAKKRRAPKYEFKPDRKQYNILKKLYITQLQRKQYLKWGLLAMLTVLMMVIQDVMLSQIRISGATTDLAICAILLIGLYEGTENGSLFVLLMSTFYHFSGSSPGPLTIAVATTLTIGFNLVRQMLWRRSFGSTMLCAAGAVLTYEMIIFLTGIFSGYTIWARAGVFFLTGVMTCVMLLPLYPLVRAISKIGGDTWKE